MCAVHAATRRRRFGSQLVRAARPRVVPHTDEGAITPQVYMRRVWRDEGGIMAARAHSVFVSGATPGPRSDAPPSYLLCFECRGERKLHALQISRRGEGAATGVGGVDPGAHLLQAAPAFSTSALAAAAVATPDDCLDTTARLQQCDGLLLEAPRDLLVLRPDMSARLMAGELELLPVSLPAGVGVTGFGDGIGARVTVSVASGPSLRMALQPALLSPLTRKCLEVCLTTLAPNAARVLWARVVALEAQVVPGGCSGDDACAASWAAFVFVVAAALSVSTCPLGVHALQVRPASPAAEAASTSGSSGGDAAWAALLSSRFHKRHSHGAGVAAGGDAACGAFEAALRRCAGVIGGDAASLGAAPAVRALGDAMPAVFGALHCAYQDLRLQVLAGVVDAGDAKHLAGLLAAVASSVGDERYVDLYLRDWGQLSPGCMFHPATAAEDGGRGDGGRRVLPPPWDVFRWCAARVHGDTCAEPPQALRGETVGALSTVAGVVRVYTALSSVPPQQEEEQDATMGAFVDEDAPAGASMVVGFAAMPAADADVSAISSRASTRDTSARGGMSGTGALALAAAAAHANSTFTNASSMFRTDSGRSLLSAGGSDDLNGNPASLGLNVTRRASRSSDYAAVLALVAEDETRDAPLLSSVPFAVALPIQDALRRCRQAPGHGWSQAAYEAVGRPELAAMRYGRVDRVPAPVPQASTGDADGLDAVMVRGRVWLGADVERTVAEPSPWLLSCCLFVLCCGVWRVACGVHQSQTSLRFGSDRRMAEVCRLLQSSAPSCIRPHHLRVLLERDDEVMAVQVRPHSPRHALVCTRTPPRVDSGLHVAPPHHRYGCSG